MDQLLTADLRTEPSPVRFDPDEILVLTQAWVESNLRSRGGRVGHEARLFLVLDMVLFARFASHQLRDLTLDYEDAVVRGNGSVGESWERLVAWTAGQRRRWVFDQGRFELSYEDD